MSERTRKYTEGEIGDLRVIEDFLPPPADLVLREDTVKVTLALSRRSVDFFKEEAGKARVPYQRMIRALVDAYTERAGKAGVELCTSAVGGIFGFFFHPGPVTHFEEAKKSTGVLTMLRDLLGGARSM